MKHLLLSFLLFCFVSYADAQHDHGHDHDHTSITVEGTDYDKDLLPASFHKQRREALRSLMPDSSVAVFFANPIRNYSNDVDYEFHQDPNFYYLTGLNETNAVLF